MWAKRSSSSSAVLCTAHSALTWWVRMRSSTRPRKWRSESSRTWASKIAARALPRSSSARACTRLSSVWAWLAPSCRRATSVSTWSSAMWKRKTSGPRVSMHTARPMAMPEDTPMPWRICISAAGIGSPKSALFVEAVGDQLRHRAHGVLFVVAVATDRHPGPLAGGQQQDAEDALGVDLLAVLLHRHPALEFSRGVHQLGRRSRVQAEPVDDLRLALDHAFFVPTAPATPAFVTGIIPESMHFPFSTRSPARQMLFCPLAWSARARSAMVPSWLPAQQA